MALICVCGAKECSGCRACTETGEHKIRCSLCGRIFKSEKAKAHGAFIDLCRSCYNAVKHGGM